MNYDREIELLAHPENFVPPPDEPEKPDEDAGLWDSIMAEAEAHQPD